MLYFHGISSGVLCVIFGIYEKLLDSILNFFKDIKRNFKFLFPLFIGVGIGVLLFSNILNYLLSLEDNYPLFAKDILKIKEKLNSSNLTLEDNKKIIIELLKLFHCNSVNANLSSYGLGDRIGRLSGNNITTGTIINKSVTGIKETSYEL